METEDAVKIKENPLRKAAKELGADAVKFYYNKENISGVTRNISTVCLLLKNKEVVARGISICSTREQHIKKDGRSRAFGRARRALVKEENGEPINDSPNRFMPLKHITVEELLYPLTRTKSEYGVYKSVFMPELTAKEKLILSDK
jgi:hypothetical protein